MFFLNLFLLPLNDETDEENVANFWEPRFVCKSTSQHRSFYFKFRVCHIRSLQVQVSSYSHFCIVASQFFSTCVDTLLYVFLARIESFSTAFIAYFQYNSAFWCRSTFEPCRYLLFAESQSKPCSQIVFLRG